MLANEYKCASSCGKWTKSWCSDFLLCKRLKLSWGGLLARTGLPLMDVWMAWMAWVALRFGGDRLAHRFVVWIIARRAIPFLSGLLPQLKFVNPAATRVECGCRGCSSMVEQRLPKPRHIKNSYFDARFRRAKIPFPENST